MIHTYMKSFLFDIITKVVKVKSGFIAVDCLHFIYCAIRDNERKRIIKLARAPAPYENTIF